MIWFGWSSDIYSFVRIVFQNEVIDRLHQTKLDLKFDNNQSKQTSLENLEKVGWNWSLSGSEFGESLQCEECVTKNSTQL